MKFEDCILPQKAVEVSFSQPRANGVIKYPKRLVKESFNIAKEFCEATKIDFNFYKYVTIEYDGNYWEIDFLQNMDLDEPAVSVYNVHYEGKQGILIYKVRLRF